MIVPIILAAGQGTRMVSDVPKVLHSLAGKAMVHYTIDAALGLPGIGQPIVVVSPNIDAAKVQGGRNVGTVVQTQPLGTGHAVGIGLDILSDVSQTVFILYGDMPLVETDVLATILSHHQARCAPCLTVVGMQPEMPGSYGRIVADGSGRIDRIVEYRDASEGERAISLCNSGIIVTECLLLKRLVEKLTPHNEAGEYYLTDVVALAREEGIPSWVVELPAQSLQGINNRLDLAKATQVLQERWRCRFMEQGATLVDPSSVFFAYDTKIGRDVTINPNVTFGPGVTVGNRAHILPGCHIEKTTLGDDVTVGPFAHLREGVVVGNQVSIGNFVEIKSTTIGNNTKAKHLAYLGNATIGQNVNIGAGTITCNHNGFVKSATMIGDGAYIGSNSCLIAPVSVGAGAMVAAGSVIHKDVPTDALGVARERQENKLGWAVQFRARYQ